MHVIDLAQGGPEWLAWRRQGVTASDATTLTGRNPTIAATPWRLWMEKKGKLTHDDAQASYPVRRGREAESTVREWLERRSGDILLPLCGEYEAWPVLRASFDGVTSAGVPVEIKVPLDGGFLDVEGLAESSSRYRRYYPQVQAQIAVADQDHGILVFAEVRRGPGGNMEVTDAREFIVRRDQSFIDDMIRKAEEFWELVETDREPAKSPGSDSYEPSGGDIAIWRDAASKIEEADRLIKAYEAQITWAKAQREEAQTQLLNLMGSYANASFEGMTVNRFHRRGHVDYEAMLKSLGVAVDQKTLDAHRRPGAAGVRITCNR